MPELDFINMQILEEDKRTTTQKLNNCVALGSCLLVLYSLFMIGLALENAWLLISYIFLLAAAAYGWRRLPSADAWFKNLYKENKAFSFIFISLLLISYPFVFVHNPYLIHMGALCGIFVIMALGLNITLGFAGLLDLGFAVYFAAGAYTSAQLAVNFGVSFWPGLVLGGLVASFFGFIVAWPALRVHDQYLALVTLGYGLMMNLLHRNLRFLTNGTDGVINIPPPSIGGFEFVQPLLLGGLKLPFQTNFYYLAIFLVGLTIFVSIRLRDSKMGRAWEAIREDEVAGKCFGINLTFYKVIAFTTGAFFGGVAGSLFAHMIGFIHPDNFIYMVSMTVMCMVIVGGMGNIFGVVLGAIFLIMVPERLREFQSMRLLLFGASILLLMLFRPQGIFPNVRRRRELERKKLYGLIEKSGAEDIESGSGVEV